MDNLIWAFWCGWMSGVGIGAGIMFLLTLDYPELVRRMKKILWVRIYTERESK